MQSVNSVRGMARRRGSQETLLARGIAVPRKTSGRLPVIAETRRLITRSPRSIRLGRIGRESKRADSLELRGMLRVVGHMVEVQEEAS